MSEQKFYVYFEKSSGNIRKVSGKQEDTTDDILSVVVTYDQVKDIYEGKKSFNDYVVDYDLKNTKHVLLLKNADFKSYDINEYLYKIPVEEIKSPEVIIVQNLIKKQWEVKLSRKLSNKIKEDGFFSYSKMLFSVTKQDDPNIIYRSFKVSIQDIVNKSSVKIPFTSKHEHELLSVFTTKHFGTYFHKVKNEQ